MLKAKLDFHAGSQNSLFLAPSDDSKCVSDFAANAQAFGAIMRHSGSYIVISHLMVKTRVMKMCYKQLFISCYLIFILMFDPSLNSILGR